MPIEILNSLEVEYCDNDVIATEAVFNDWTARQILADVAGTTVNEKDE